MHCSKYFKLAVLLFSFLIFACSQQEKTNVENKKETAPTPTKEAKSEKSFGGMLFEGSIGDASNLIPILASDSVSHSVASFVYNGLLKYNKNLKLVGDLAKDWEISDNKKTITFNLRKDVKWHDGEPFTAEDVKFTYKTIIDKDTPTAYDADFKIIDNVTIPDNYTVRVNYKTPFAPALNSWTMSILAKHLLEGKKITQSPLQRNPVGTGPFKFVKWEPGKSITLKANKDYFKGSPYLAKYVLKIIPDTAAMFMTLLNQDIDLMSMSPLQYTKQTDTSQFENHFNKYSYLSNSYTYIGYNLKKEMFEDKKVRQALSCATPKKGIIDSVLFGQGKVATGPYKPGTYWYNPDVPRYNYNLEKAKQLLAEAGWKDTDGDKILEKNGKEFSFTLMTNQGNSSRSKIAEIVQQSWEKLGIKVEIRVIEWATLINEYIDKRNFDALVMGWSIPLEPDLYNVWHSSKCKGKNLNFICYQNEKLDKLIEKARLTFDMEKRKELYFKAQEILAEDQPYTFLYVPKALVGLHKRFRGVEPAPAGITYNLEEWYVPEGLRKYELKQ
ncbi:ABC-type transporter, periplasmic subunit [Flexistipes sinusarabici DSM 4947]|uniref:ABC-type transporter, periplasmic subunit n=1 Tax=Flexistipes sinusarabici (strain ATCC 49648 / DSM 4947 / MAS 10) TaxID=717231 RepID=F8EA02_FLESM|nr:peptide-binding protein [Flexistipes sinusarabici]AEI15413.1 ABC-type transporter, periplasmic subunit [Flexistipes sinusarabici DSM 4947]